jgi:hypothetical protein
MRSALPSLLVSLLTVACHYPSAVSSMAPDAGTPDAGDAGTPDAGDAGTPDAGDGGATSADAGDGGATSPDAGDEGTPSPDAGLTTDAGKAPFVCPPDPVIDAGSCEAGYWSWSNPTPMGANLVDIWGSSEDDV